jgi:hypothetical protein
MSRKSKRQKKKEGNRLSSMKVFNHSTAVLIEELIQHAISNWFVMQPIQWGYT